VIDVKVEAKLAEIRQTVEAARAMPMSASCVLNRAELLAALEELAELLPPASGPAAAEARRDELVSDSVPVQLARSEAERLLAESRQEATELRRETDDYVDERLANFELTLVKTLEAVQRGRERLRGRSELDTLGGAATDLIELPNHD